jgi:hypothetical protein
MRMGMNAQDGASEKNRDDVAGMVRESNQAVRDSRDIIDRVEQGKHPRTEAKDLKQSEGADAEKRA